MTYSLLREIADSWVLLAMTLFFLGCGLWAFRPGSRRLHDEAANLIFAPSDTPRPEVGPSRASCGRGCEGCTCTQAEARP